MIHSIDIFWVVAPGTNLFKGCKIGAPDKLTTATQSLGRPVREISSCREEKRESRLGEKRESRIGEKRESRLEK